MAHECNETTNRRTRMPETVCVTVEQLRRIERHIGVDGWCHWCPVCGSALEEGHHADCWLGNAIAQAERLEDWKPEVGDLVRLKTMPEIRGKIVKIFGITAYIQVEGEPENWRLDRYLTELMLEEGE